MRCCYLERQAPTLPFQLFPLSPNSLTCPLPGHIFSVTQCLPPYISLHLSLKVKSKSSKCNGKNIVGFPWPSQAFLYPVSLTPEFAYIIYHQSTMAHHYPKTKQVITSFHHPPKLKSAHPPLTFPSVPYHSSPLAAYQSSLIHEMLTGYLLCFRHCHGHEDTQ